MLVEEKMINIAYTCYYGIFIVERKDGVMASFALAMCSGYEYHYYHDNCICN